MDMQSETIGKLAEALAKAQGQMESAKFDRRNPHFGAKYASLAAVMDAARKPLSENGLSVVQTTELTERGVILHTWLLHASGEWTRSIYPVIPVKNDPQGMGSALTYARRYNFAAIVGIASEDDDDGNEASGKGASHGAANGNGVTNGKVQEKPQHRQTPPPAKESSANKNAPAAAKSDELPDMVSADTLAEIEQSGSAHYGPLWEAKRVEIVDAITEGAAKGQLGRMTVQEGAKMLKGIKNKIEAAAIAAAQGRAA